MKRDVMKVLANGKDKINPHYEMTADDMQKIRANSGVLFSAIENSFVFGYIQGVKAEKKRVRK